MTKSRTIVRKILASLLIISSGVVSAHLPDLGNEFRSAVSIHDERLIGRSMMWQLRSAGLVHEDPIITEYVRHIGHRLTPYMDMPYKDLNIKIFALNDPSVNAMAFFGGHLVVNSGLISIAETESELAGVMAHELGHVSQQHVLRIITDGKRLMPLTIAEALAAVAIGVPELIIPALAGHTQQMLNFSRQYEQEADRVGVRILAKANFDPQGLPDMFERFANIARMENKFPEYMSTHPTNESRIADTRNYANQYKIKQQANSNMFYLVRARIRVQSAANMHDLLDKFEHELKTKRYKNELAARYGYAYALLRKGKPNEAKVIMAGLLAQNPDDLIINLTAAEIDVELHQYKNAKAKLDHLMQIYPESSAVLLQYTDLLLIMKQPKAAKNMLAKYKESNLPEPMYYEYVRQSEGMLGNQTAVHEANAEWYLLHGDLGSCLAQLQQAYSIKSNDTKTNNRIKARAQEVQDLMQQMKAV